MIGLVVKNTGSWYIVKAEDGQLIECKMKGNLRMRDIRSTNPIAVGDRVVYEQNVEETAVISEICERKNFIVRRSSNLSKHAHILAANIDLVVLVATINYPETSTVFIDRFLATAEAYQVQACLIFNKTDCYSENELTYLDNLAFLYETIGYPVFKTSALSVDGLEELRVFLQGKTSLISGNSGVGKSTLINLLSPQSQAKTAEISAYHNKGMHTTTFSEMFELPKGGYVIDTPGIKGFGTIDMNEAEIGHYFKEIFSFSKKCKFADCTHTHEPDCAVLGALDNHYISQSRYKSYLSVLEDCKSGKYR